jgi:hypothetical protein
MSSLTATLWKAGESGWLIRASDAGFTARQEWQALRLAGNQPPGSRANTTPGKSATSGSLPDAA